MYVYTHTHRFTHSTHQPASWWKQLTLWSQVMFHKFPASFTFSPLSSSFCLSLPVSPLPQCWTSCRLKSRLGRTWQVTCSPHRLPPSSTPWPAGAVAMDWDPSRFRLRRHWLLRHWQLHWDSEALGRQLAESRRRCQLPESRPMLYLVGSWQWHSVSVGSWLSPSSSTLVTALGCDGSGRRLWLQKKRRRKREA